MPLQVRLVDVAPYPLSSCVSNAPDQVSDDEAPISCLHVTSPPHSSARAAPASPDNSDDDIPILRFSHRPALVSCSGDAEVLLLRPSLSHPYSSTTPPIIRPRPALQAGGAADALSGTVDTDLLLLPPPLELSHSVGDKHWEGKWRDNRTAEGPGEEPHHQKRKQKDSDGVKCADGELSSALQHGQRHYFMHLQQGVE
jgi:hypothetical protein